MKYKDKKYIKYILNHKELFTPEEVLYVKKIKMYNKSQKRQCKQKN